MRKKTIKEITDILDKNTQLELISTDYINRRTPMIFRCKKCGKEFKTTLASILASKHKDKYKKYCNECSLEELSDKFSMGHEEFVNKVNNVLGDEYEVLGKYVNNKIKVDILHKKCGYIWNAKPSVIINQKSKCPKCFNTIKKTTQSFQEEICIEFGDEFELISEYENYHTSVLIKHNKCGRVFKSQPANFMTYKSCPLCSKDGKSKGEDKIAKILKNEGVKFIREKRFKDCKNKRSLPFDFYLPDMNVAIEYDGEQHFKPKFYYDEKGLEEIKIKDEIKNEYCKSNNIKLIRIPYTEFDNIENILKASI